MVLDPSTMETFYWYSAIIGTVVLLLKTALPADFGTEVGGDFTSITDTDASFHLLTIEGISSFFLSFGWMGWFSFTQFHYELKTSLIVAVISGLIGMSLFGWLLTLAKKLQHFTSYNLSDLNGKEGKAYVHFEPKGPGKIQIEFNEKLSTLDAVNNSDELIDAFTPVKVVKIENNVIYIEKVQ